MSSLLTLRVCLSEAGVEEFDGHRQKLLPVSVVHFGGFSLSLNVVL